MSNTKQATAEEEIKQATAEEETKQATAVDMNKRVSIYVPKAESKRDDPNLFVGVNGANYLLPRGKTSMVPAFVAEEIKRALEAEDAYDDMKAALAENE